MIITCFVLYAWAGFSVGCLLYILTESNKGNAIYIASGLAWPIVIPIFAVVIASQKFKNEIDVKKESLF